MALKRADGVVEDKIMSYSTLGRKASRKNLAKVQRYLDELTDTLDVKQTSGVSAVGILLVIYGAFSLLFAVILGAFDDKEDPKARPKRPPAHKPHHRQ